MTIRNATIETNRGTLTAELFERDCPETVEAFTRLANAGHYDGMRLASPGAGTVVEGVATLPEEDAILPVEAIGNRNRPVPGTLVLGRRGDASDASRLFFVVGADAGKRLVGTHTVFGCTDDGIEVLRRLGPGDAVHRVRVTE